MNWYPSKQVHSITDVSLDLLKEQGIKGIILDIDNTLTTHDNPVPSEGVAQWLENMRTHEIQMIVLSNNKPSRVEPFAKILGLDYIADGKKPLLGGYRRCAQALGLSSSELCMIGDQILTDVWGGNRFGCFTVLVEPIRPEPMLFFRVKRRIEKAILAHAGRKK